MMFHFRDLILIVNEDNDGIEIGVFTGIDPSFGEDDDLVAWLEEASRWAVKADVAVAALARDDVGLPKNGVRNICNIDVLKRFYAARVEEIFVDRNRADVV